MTNYTESSFRWGAAAGVTRPARSLVSLVALLASGVLPAEAQVAEPAPEVQRTWASFGYGLAALAGADAEGTYSFAGQFGLHHQRSRYVASLRTAVLFDIFGDTGFVDIGLLVGRATRTRRSHASAGVGLALVQGTDPITYAAVTTIGVPLEAQVFYSAGLLGLGLYGFASVNPERTFGGVTLSLQFGKL